MKGNRVSDVRRLAVLVMFFQGPVLAGGDADGDGIRDAEDNCPLLADPSQGDSDLDGIGNLCDCEDATYVFHRGRLRPEILISAAGLGDVDGDGVDDLVLGEARAGAECGDETTAIGVISGRTRALLWELESGEPCDEFGAAVSSAGDVDDDGFGDVIVGAREGGERGRVYVYSGASGDALLSGGNSFSLQGEELGDGFGTSVAGIGDVNGDGVDDFAVGAPRHGTSGATGIIRRGKVYVYRGGRDGDPEAGGLLYAIEGEVSGERFGFSLAGGGDFNLDGIPDIAVGARAADPNALGRVRVCSGADGRLLFQLAGESPGDAFGVSVSFAGDVDGDGFDDIVVGAPGQADGGEPGKAYIIAGGAAETPGEEPGVLGTIAGIEPGDLFGTTVCGVGDQDGDGLSEVAIGAPGADAGSLSEAGRVRVHSSQRGQVLADLGGSGPEARFGVRIASPGDLDGDGRRDLIVSDEVPPGRASLYLLGDSDGNGRRDVCEPCWETEPLEPGKDLEFTICPLVPRLCSRIDPRPGRVLRITLENAPGDEVTMALRWDGTPTVRESDQVAVRRSSEEQRIVVPRARDAVAYIVVESFMVGACAEGLRIRMEEFDAPVLEEMEPSFSGTKSELDAVIRGGGFVDGLEFSLEPRSGDPAAGSLSGETTIVDSEIAEVSFDLSEGSFGFYDLVAFEGEKPVSRLEKAFAINVTRGPALQVALKGPKFYRVRDRRTLTLRYGNAGDEDIQAPLFRIFSSDPDIKMGFPGDGPESWRPEIQALGLSGNGPTHRLQPGAREKITIFFRSTDRCDGCPLRFTVLAFTPDQRDFIDWQRLPNPDPGVVADERWRRILSPLSVNFGLTWGDYHESLLDRARRLVLRGESAVSTREPFRFAVAEAEGQPSAAILGTVTLAGSLSPLAGATVSALEKGEVRATAVTGSRGQFTLSGVESGETYDIAVAGHAIVGEANGQARVSVPEERYSQDGRGDLLNLVLEVEPRPTARKLLLQGAQSPPLPEAPLALPDELFTPVAGWETKIVKSQDPNKKTDDTVPGDPLFDLNDEKEEAEEESSACKRPPVIEYTIYFENSRCTSVAARRVTVIDTLDAEFFDLTTLRLKNISLGEDLEEKLIVLDADIWGKWRLFRSVKDVPVAIMDPDRELPPECAKEVVPDCPEEGEAAGAASPEYGVLDSVEIEISLSEFPDQKVYELVWDINGCPTSCGAIVGFLAPNDCATHQGEGFVTFTVSPKEGYEDGVVENDAEVIFDDDPKEVESHTVTTVLAPSDRPEPVTNPVPRDNPDGDEEFLVPTGQILSWTPVLWAQDCHLSVWKLDGGGDPAEQVVDGPELAGPFYRPPPEAPWDLSTTYEWKVVVTNEFGDSDAATWTFRTEGPPPPPPDPGFELDHPPDGSDGVATDVTLAWEPGAGEPEPESYTVYLWDALEERDRPEAHLGDVTEYQPLGLESAVTYNWQIVGVNNGGETEGPVWRFTTEEQAFRRGDSDADGEVNITDPIFTLNFLFLGTSTVTCLRAADFDGDGSLFINDAISELNFLFLGGPPAPPPVEACGTDPAADELSCDSFPVCD